MFQTVRTLDGLIVTGHGLMGGSRKDWALYVNSFMEEKFTTIFMLTEFSNNSIETAETTNILIWTPHAFDVQRISSARASNLETSKVRVTVEGINK